MASGSFTVDGSTKWFRVVSPNVHIGMSGGFGGGTVTIEKRVNGNTSDLLDGGTALTFTAADDSDYAIGGGDEIRLTLAGATTPTLDWNLNGEINVLDA